MNETLGFLNENLVYSASTVASITATDICFKYRLIESDILISSDDRLHSYENL